MGELGLYQWKILSENQRVKSNTVTCGRKITSSDDTGVIDINKWANSL